jgi:hypothetical protein
MELLRIIESNLGAFAVPLSIIIGNGLYNLYQGYRLSHRSLPDEQVFTERSKWFLQRGKIVLLIAILFLTLLCCIALLLHVQSQTIVILVVSSVFISPFCAIVYIFVYRKGEMYE